MEHMHTEQQHVIMDMVQKQSKQQATITNIEQLQANQQTTIVNIEKLQIQNNDSQTKHLSALTAFMSKMESKMDLCLVHKVDPPNSYYHHN
jgi:hypothetical protein